MAREATDGDTRFHLRWRRAKYECCAGAVVRTEIGLIMKVQVIDIGWNNGKVLISKATDPRKFPSGPTLTPHQLVLEVQKLIQDWHYNAISIGNSGSVRKNRPVREPPKLGRGWVKFDFGKAFGVPEEGRNPFV